MIRSNPFPDYRVTRLSDEPTVVGHETIPTDAIRESRRRVEDYVSQWQSKKSGDDVLKLAPAIVAVVGDFGTGKTHLLLDALAQVQRELSTAYPDTMILRVPCVEATPESWFRTTIGPALKPEPGKGPKRPIFQDVVVRLYAHAGVLVAKRAKMTAPAIDKLEEKPYLIYRLIKENLLNVTAVDQEFRVLLSETCLDVGEEVQRAVSGLVWAQTADAATRALTGDTLDLADADRLRIEQAFPTDRNVRDILVALAAIHGYLSRPFGIMIDELEHLTRYDETKTNQSKGNLTWLKRLLESLGRYPTLVYIAGHQSAWTTKFSEGGGDFLGRFSYMSAIRLDRLSSNDVLNIVRARVKDLQSENFDLPQAEAILESAGPSMRRILSLCRVLYTESQGFQVAVPKEKISQLALQMKQRVTPEDVALHVREFFEAREMSVQTDVLVARNIRFGLVAYQEKPKVIVEFKHAMVPAEQVEYARRFVARMQEVQKDLPDIIGCLVSDGNVDDKAIDAFRSTPGINILSFDLNEPDFVARFTSDLDLALKAEPRGVGGTKRAHLKELLEEQERVTEEVARSGDDPELLDQLHSRREVLEEQVVELRQELAARTADLERKLSALAQQRFAEYEEQRAWQDQFAQSLSSQREAEIVSPGHEREEIDAGLNNTYAELTKPLSFNTKLRFALEGHIPALLALFFIGLSVFLFTQVGYFGDAIMVLSYLIAGFCLLFALFRIWRRLLLVDTYLDYSMRVLREVYIRSPSAEDLVRAHNILRDSLEEEGPIYGRSQARMRLASDMSEYFAEPSAGEARDPSILLP